MVYKYLIAFWFLALPLSTHAAAPKTCGSALAGISGTRPAKLGKKARRASMIAALVTAIPVAPAHADLITNQIATEAESLADTVNDVIGHLTEDGRLRKTWDKDNGPASMCYATNLMVQLGSVPEAKFLRFANPRDPKQVAAIKAWTETLQDVDRTISDFCAFGSSNLATVPPVQLSLVMVNQLKTARDKLNSIAGVFKRREAVRGADPVPLAKMKYQSSQVIALTKDILRHIRESLNNPEELVKTNLAFRAKVAYGLGGVAGRWLASGFEYDQVRESGDHRISLGGSNLCTASFLRASDRLLARQVDFMGEESAQANETFVSRAPALIETIAAAETMIDRAQIECHPLGDQRPSTMIVDMLKGHADDMQDAIELVSIDGRLRKAWDTESDPLRLCDILANQSPVKILDPLYRLVNLTDAAQNKAYDYVTDEWTTLKHVGESFCGLTLANQTIIPPGQLSKPLLLQLTRVRNADLNAVKFFSNPALQARASIGEGVSIDYPEELSQIETHLGALDQRLTKFESLSTKFEQKLTIKYQIHSVENQVVKLQTWGSPSPECRLVLDEVRKKLQFAHFDSATGVIAAQSLSNLKEAVGMKGQLRRFCK